MVLTYPSGYMFGKGVYFADVSSCARATEAYMLTVAIVTDDVEGDRTMTSTYAILTAPPVCQLLSRIVSSALDLSKALIFMHLP